MKILQVGLRRCRIANLVSMVQMKFEAAMLAMNVFKVGVRRGEGE